MTLFSRRNAYWWALLILVKLSLTADRLLPPDLQLDRVPHEYVYATDDYVLHPDQLAV
jgi:hypothetical protein